VEPDAVEEALHTASTTQAPGGPVEMIEGTRHAKMPTYIGQFTDEGLDIVQTIEPAVEPTQCL
jgi:hypothetical protein